MNDNKFELAFRVDWEHLDANLHVANTQYNAFATNARCAFLFSIGYTFSHSAKIGPVVLQDTISYRRELRLGDSGTVKIQLSGLSLDGARWKVKQDIYKASGELSATIDTLGGWMSLTERKLVKPEGEFVTLFNNLDRSQGFEVLKNIVR
jgi:acyl-CoA thioester hydrolase